MAPEHSAEVLSEAQERCDVSYKKIYWGMSYSAVGCEFDVNERTMYIKMS